MSELKIAWLFPDTLFLHGERGNLLALKRYGEMAGMTVSVNKIDFATEGFDPGNYDIIFCAPGEISSFPAVYDWLLPYKDKLDEFIKAGKPLIVTGTSVGLFGSEIVRTDGSKIKGLGLVSLYATENNDVYGDDNWFECVYNGQQFQMIGNQIQMNDLVLTGAEPFGKLEYGYGNCGKNREEGAIVNNSIFTNTLGPMLICDPWLTVEIIKVAASNKGEEFKGIDYDMELEKKSFETKKRLITTKESRLVNCK
ncbi:cobalamin biosynthesis protein CobQ [Aminicella lysinilytica]|uniref:CobB/CobQ-like glutamine amidotransferase domain-containing protein n=1 Tax=Aminicella lysinilytica TaxID=433323 RepID=A0A4V3CQZ9_9FIRM|nr:cobalamin biosynthesis protein CobQ [Aminicella lysinilytica]TDP52397.1 hypothetical protein EV211_1263 [Aminicella lysinilytica]